jgi:hypothetical protein
MSNTGVPNTSRLQEFIDRIRMSSGRLNNLYGGYTPTLGSGGFPAATLPMRTPQEVAEARKLTSTQAGLFAAALASLGVASAASGGGAAGAGTIAARAGLPALTARALPALGAGSGGAFLPVVARRSLPVSRAGQAAGRAAGRPALGAGQGSAASGPGNAVVPYDRLEALRSRILSDPKLFEEAARWWARRGGGGVGRAAGAAGRAGNAGQRALPGPAGQAAASGGQAGPAGAANLFQRLAARFPRLARLATSPSGQAAGIGAAQYLSTRGGRGELENTELRSSLANTPGNVRPAYAPPGGLFGTGTGGGGGGGGGFNSALFQLTETEEERRLLQRALDDITARQRAGDQALKTGWSQLQTSNRVAADKARGMAVEYGDRASQLWSQAAQQARESADVRAQAEGQWAGMQAMETDSSAATPTIEYMQTQAPAEQVYAERQGNILASDYEWMAESAGEQGQAYRGQLMRDANIISAQIAQEHNQRVLDRIANERMMMAQMQASSGSGSGGQEFDPVRVNNILGMAIRFRDPNYLLQLNPNMTYEQAVQELERITNTPFGASILAGG